MQRAGNHGTVNASNRPVSSSTPGLRCTIRRPCTERAAWTPEGAYRVGNDTDGQSHTGITQSGIAGHAHFFGRIPVAYDVSLSPASRRAGRTGFSRTGETLAAIAQ